MTYKKAKVLVTTSLKFGDPASIEAVELITKAEAGFTGKGPAIACTCCQDATKPLKIHRIGCFVCDDCGSELDISCPEQHQDSR